MEAPFNPQNPFLHLSVSLNLPFNKLSQQKSKQAAQAKVPGAARILASDIYATAKARPLLDMEPVSMPKKGAVIKNTVLCAMRCVVIIGTHTFALVTAPTSFTWSWFGIAVAIYAVHGIFGITAG